MPDGIRSRAHADRPRPAVPARPTTAVPARRRGRRVHRAGRHPDVADRHELGRAVARRRRPGHLLHSPSPGAVLRQCHRRHRQPGDGAARHLRPTGRTSRGPHRRRRSGPGSRRHVHRAPGVSRRRNRRRAVPAVRPAGPVVALPVRIRRRAELPAARRPVRLHQPDHGRRRHRLLRRPRTALGADRAHSVHPRGWACPSTPGSRAPSSSPSASFS
jgi:hypothetical protein